MPLLVERPKVFSKTTDLVEQRERLRSDYRWIANERSALQKEYLNKYVAVKDKQVVTAESNVYSLMKKLKTKGLRTDAVAVEFLSEQPVCFLL